MSKHTPGPWQYVFEGGTTAFITEADGSTIICIRTTENTTAHKNLVANARLIAAAPRMLELLKRLLPIAEDAAESLGRFCSDEGWAQEDMDRMDNVDGMLPLMRAAIAKAEEEE